mmetsp:Transcript_93081/g.300871  ORF Transcript_93081/g.300871 Transcript_93081/m.300871 type:complete len:299 (+) Transcript_93081:160-1056(+)
MITSSNLKNMLPSLCDGTMLPLHKVDLQTITWLGRAGSVQLALATPCPKQVVPSVSRRRLTPRPNPVFMCKTRRVTTNCNTSACINTPSEPLAKCPIQVQCLLSAMSAQLSRLSCLQSSRIRRAGVPGSSVGKHGSRLSAHCPRANAPPLSAASLRSDTCREHHRLSARRRLQIQVSSSEPRPPDREHGRQCSLCGAGWGTWAPRTRSSSPPPSSCSLTTCTACGRWLRNAQHGRGDVAHPNLVVCISTFTVVAHASGWRIRLVLHGALLVVKLDEATLRVELVVVGVRLFQDLSRQA